MVEWLVQVTNVLDHPESQVAITVQFGAHRCYRALVEVELGVLGELVELVLTQDLQHDV